MLTDVRIQITRNVTRRGTKDGSVDTANDATSQYVYVMLEIMFVAMLTQHVGARKSRGLPLMDL